jgi:hypothetical protein
MKLWPFHMERRAEPHRKVELAASFQVRDEFSGTHLTPEHPALIIDLSPSGCCLALDQLDPGGFHLHRCLEEPGDYPLELRVRLNGDEPMVLRAEVKWLNRELRATGRPFRVGLRFRQGARGTPLPWRRLSRSL